MVKLYIVELLFQNRFVDFPCSILTSLAIALSFLSNLG
jgi:hypothetical protein